MLRLKIEPDVNVVISYFHCRYTYFPSSRRQFGLLGPSLLEIDHDERPEDGTLASSLAVSTSQHLSVERFSSLGFLIIIPCFLF